MKILSVLIFLLCGGASTAFALSPDMTLDFSWIGTALCTPRPNSPEFHVDNVPAGTTQLRFMLISPNGRELGGADVPLPVRGLVSQGAVSFRSPCVGGMYTWTVEAMDAEGKLLGAAKLTRPFY